MSNALGFPPLVGESPRVLILGSLPGQASLRAQAYYAMPRNAFWPILATVIGTPADAQYTSRCAALVDKGIALWDVCASARRQGSLDADIERDSVEPNPLGRLLTDHSSIQAILFNGQAAAALYARHVIQTLSPVAAALPRITLPSTSPAHARLSFQRKAAQWHASLAMQLDHR